MAVTADDPRVAEFLRYVTAFIHEAPDLAHLQEQMSRVLSLGSEGAAGVPGVVAGQSSPAEQALARKLPGRLGDRGLAFQVSCLMNDPVKDAPDCLRLSPKKPRAGLGYAHQRRAWGSILRDCEERPEDLEAVLAWVRAERAALEHPPGLEKPLRRGGQEGPPGLELTRRPKGARPRATECLRGGSRSGGSLRPSPLLRLPPATASIRLVSTAWGHPNLPHVGHARQFDCHLYFGDEAMAGAEPYCGHHGGHPDRLDAAARHPGMQIALAVLDSAIDSQDGPAPLEVLFLMCSSGRGPSVSVAILLGELLQRLGYAVLIQHCVLQDGDPHEQVCESCRARRPLPETSSLLLRLWHDPCLSGGAMP